MMNSHPALRLTPQNSPFYRNTAPKSPSKASTSRTEEPGLRLRKVIGLTAASSNAFDSHPPTCSFAYTAGATAALVTVGPDLLTTQRFFRARPAAHTRETTSWPSSPTPSEPRKTPLTHVREHNLSGSPLAASRDWSDSPTTRTSSAKDRVKAVTSVALSPNGKWLAVGETGYKPRIAIFSLAEDSGDAPVAVIAEHSFGVHALRFSGDSKFLASLGTVNDGFLFVWSVDERTGAVALCASNKLTALTGAVAWVGNTLITAGLRFVKVWRPNEEAGPEPKGLDGGSSSLLTPRHRAENRSSDYGNSILSPGHKTLAGKNTLLEELLECNFVAVVSVSDTQAILCAETGEICLLDDRDKVQSITLIQTAAFRITAARLNADGSLHVLGAEGHSKVLDAATYLHPSPPPSRTRRNSASPYKASFSNTQCVIASTAFSNIIVELDSERTITLRKNPPSDDENSTIHLAAHKDPVQGVQPFSSALLPSARFLTFSATGTLHFWSTSGAHVTTFTVPLPSPSAPQGYANELKNVAFSPNGAWLACGDKYGVLSILDLESNTTIAQERAHSAEVLDVVTFTFEGCEFIATAGRDRMVQLFQFSDSQLSLAQTMDEHAGAVTGILFDSVGKRLVSHAADRALVIRESFLRDGDDPTSLAFAMTRSIPLKASPTSVCLCGEGEVLVSTVDRCVARYKLKNGHCVSGFKGSDSEGGEAVVLSKILWAAGVGGGGGAVIAGVSSSDKSVRLYTEHGVLVARDWGHTEGIMDLCLLREDGEGEREGKAPRLVTVAADSTVFLWDTLLPASTNTSLQACDPAHASTHLDTPPLGPPLRKIFSHTELSRFRRKKSIGMNNANPNPANASATNTGNANGRHSREGTSEPPSPSPSSATLAPSPSPERVRKRPSRVSVAPPPRLEPAFRVSAASSPRQERLKGRSPSPPSPRNSPRSTLGKTRHVRRRSPDKETSTRGTWGLDVTSASLCQSLRAYRAKLSTAPDQSAGAEAEQEALAELDNELRLTASLVSEHRRGGDSGVGLGIDGATDGEAGLGKLLDEASSRLVGMLDGRIRMRVGEEVRRSSGVATPPPRAETTREADECGGEGEVDMTAVRSALKAVALGDSSGGAEAGA